MSTAVIVILIIVVIAVIVGAGLYLRRQRSARLRTQFGSEYERELKNAPNRSAAEKDLQGRQKRHSGLDLHPLEAAERDDYRKSWDHVQSEFVDSPGDAVRDADRLVIAIMRKRGYPTDDFDQRAADVSVEHPEVVEHYRDAHRIAVAHERGDAGTEELRTAAISYRSLVRALLEEKSDKVDADKDVATEGNGRNRSTDSSSPAPRQTEQQTEQQSEPSTNDRSKA
jgi:hypothetical protein